MFGLKKFIKSKVDCNSATLIELFRCINECYMCYMTYRCIQLQHLRHLMLIIFAHSPDQLRFT